jgi:succinyl-CoA synthetase alpha subunit
LTVKSLTKTSEYHDSVSLMIVAKELAKFPGVQDASVMMGTEANKALMEQSGLLTEDAKKATPNDLVISVKTDGNADEALAEAEKLLNKKAAPGGTGAEFRPKTIRGAMKVQPDSNVAIISIAGRYAAEEAWEALFAGMHVLLFSDNVSKEDELALKQYGRDHGLLVMGPGAGTAILNGVALAFANVIPAGPVGIVSAAGTGLQETSTLLAKNGIGITQGIGTGGGDVKKAIGGIMYIEGLKALQADPATKVVLMVSKMPDEEVEQTLLAQAEQSKKPTVICLMGGKTRSDKVPANVTVVSTLEEGALVAAKLAGAPIGDIKEKIAKETEEARILAKQLKATLKPGQKDLRALFSGGTLCYESQVIWRDNFSMEVYSNAPLDKHFTMKDSTRSEGNVAVDLGEEEFTVGRPHPMIDNDLRMRRILSEAADPATAVIMLDVVIGYGAHPDPATELTGAIRKAKEQAKAAGREVIFVASVTGTEQDPQGLTRTTEILQGAGVHVMKSNAMASRLAGFIIA